MKAINRTQREKKSETPDFILAEYLMDCLRAYEKATHRNHKWHELYPNIEDVEDK